METGSSRESTARVVVLRDSRWPDLPACVAGERGGRGVSAVAGAAVTEATWQGRVRLVKTDGAVRRSRRRSCRGAVARAATDGRELPTRPPGREPAPSTPKPSVTPIPGTEGAQIVLAESMPRPGRHPPRGAGRPVVALSLPRRAPSRAAGSAYTARSRSSPRRSPDSSPQRGRA